MLLYRINIGFMCKKYISPDTVINIKNDNRCTLRITFEILEQALSAYKSMISTCESLIDNLTNLDNTVSFSNDYNKCLDLWHDELKLYAFKPFKLCNDIFSTPIFELTGINYVRNINVQYKLPNYQWPVVTIATIDNFNAESNSDNITLLIGERTFSIPKSIDFFDLPNIFVLLKNIKAAFLINIKVLYAGFDILQMIKNQSC